MLFHGADPLPKTLFLLFLLFFFILLRTFYFSALCFSTYSMCILLFFFYLKRERQKSTDKGTESSPERVCVSVCVCLYVHIRSIWYCADWLRFPLPINIGDFALHRLLDFSSLSLSLWQTIQPTLRVSKREKDQPPVLFVCLFVCFFFFFLFCFFSVSIFRELSAFINFLGCRRSLSPILV